jgi:signal transduction histidine kinase
VAFYAGVPLVNAEGYPLGTLCVLDDKPKNLTENQRLSLQALARQVVSLFELKKANEQLEENKRLLQETNEELERFAYVIAHDLKSPCNNIISLTELLTAALDSELDDNKKQLLSYISSSSHVMKDLVDSVLRHARNLHSAPDNKHRVSFASLMEEIKLLVLLPAGFTMTYEPVDAYIYTSVAALEQILLNLCTNAIKYNDKTEGFVRVTLKDEAYHYSFSVADNGMGIPESSYQDIFGIFHTLGQKDRFDNTGSGIGLSTVKKLVERLGGTISVTSVVGKGSTFIFTVKK